MILRRLYEHVRTHNWFAVVIDLVIVVVGVFIGIQVSNWNTERLERRAARIYIERIREDIGVSELNFRDQIAYHRKLYEHALAAFNSFDKPNDALGESFLIDAYHASRLLVPGVVDRSTYDEMLSSGRMNSIPNIEIRRQLANYYRNMATSENFLRYEAPYREKIRRLMPWPVQYAMNQYCDTTFSLDSHGRALVSLPESCKLGLSPDVTAAAVAAIHNPDLKQDLVRRLNDLETRLKQYQRMIDQGKLLDELLADTIF